MKLRFNLNKKTLSMAVALAPVLLAQARSGAYAITTGAGAGGATAMPWDSGLGSLANELTGPTAGTIAIIAIFVAGLALIFGEDLGKFARTLLMIIIALAFLVKASGILSALGATI